MGVQMTEPLRDHRENSGEPESAFRSSLCFEGIKNILKKHNSSFYVSACLA